MLHLAVPLHFQTHLETKQLLLKGMINVIFVFLCFGDTLTDTAVTILVLH